MKLKRKYDTYWNIFYFKKTFIIDVAAKKYVKLYSYIYLST